MTPKQSPDPLSSSLRVVETASNRPDVDRLIAGVCFIFAGVVVWLYVRGLVELIDIATYWPLFLVGIGVGNLFGHRGQSKKGWTPIIIGGFLLLFNLGYTEWPFLLVAIGVAMLIRGLREGQSMRAAGDRHV